MNEVAYLFVIPVALSLVLIPLRRQPSRQWWLTLLGMALVIGGVIGARGAGMPPPELAGGFIMFLLPLLLMFLGLRAHVFSRRLYLIPLLGPPIYWLGVLISLSIVVTLGLLQP